MSDYGKAALSKIGDITRKTKEFIPPFPTRFWSKLVTKEMGVVSTFPVVRIEGDSLGEGSGSSSGAKKWNYKVFVPDSKIEYIKGKIGDNLSIVNKFDLGTSVTCNRNAIGGSTSPLALARLTAHVYKPDAIYSTSDILDKPKKEAGCDLLILSYGNNDYADEVGMVKLKWFLEEVIRSAKSQGIDVLLIVPHDRGTGTAGSRTLDRNSLKDAQQIILALAGYYGCSVLDMRSRFRQLVDDGIETADTLFPFAGDEFGAVATDNVHTNNRGQEYYALELLNILPSFEEVKTVPKNTLSTLPPRIYRQPNFFVGVNRWKMIFDNEAAQTTATSVNYGNSGNYPSTRSLFSKSDTYWKLQASGDKVRFRGIGSSVGILFMKQSTASSVNIKVNGVQTATVSFAAQSEKEYLYFVGNNIGQQSTLNIDIEWISGSVGVSGILLGSSRDPHHITSHPTSIVNFTGTWADNSTFKETTTQNDSFSISFIGTGLLADLPLGTDYGQLSISVDGGTVNNLDLYASSAITTKIQKIVSGLTYGTHTAVITVTSKNSSSTGYRCKVRNYRPIDERIDADVYETLVVNGVTLYVPEDKNGIITNAESSVLGQIGISSTKQKYRTTISN